MGTLSGIVGKRASETMMCVEAKDRSLYELIKKLAGQLRKGEDAAPKEGGEVWLLLSHHEDQSLMELGEQDFSHGRVFCLAMPPKKETRVTLDVAFIFIKGTSRLSSCCCYLY
jgi:hypothetical protein